MMTVASQNRRPDLTDVVVQFARASSTLEIYDCEQFFLCRSSADIVEWRVIVIFWLSGFLFMSQQRDYCRSSIIRSDTDP